MTEKGIMADWDLFERHGIQQVSRELEQYQELVGNNQYRIEVFVRLGPKRDQTRYGARVMRQVDLSGQGTVWVREPTVSESDLDTAEEAVQRCLRDLIEDDKRLRRASTTVPRRPRS